MLTLNFVFTSGMFSTFAQIFCTSNKSKHVIKLQNEEWDDKEECETQLGLKGVHVNQICFDIEGLNVKPLNKAY